VIEQKVAQIRVGEAIAQPATPWRRPERKSAALRAQPRGVQQLGARARGLLALQTQQE